MRKLIWLILALIASCGFAQAQTIPSRSIIIPTEPELSSQQEKELKSWLVQIQKWKEYDQKWFNKVPKGDNDRLLTRQQMPAAPTWLGLVCQNGNFVESGNLKLGCSYLDGSALYNQLDAKAEEIALETQVARSDHEKVRKTTFWTRVHMDALSTQPQVGNGPRMYGLIGSHISLVDVGRVQFYGPPGIVLISTPSISGRRTLRLGYTWGMSVRLSDFHIPGSGGHNRNATLYLDITKCWVGGLTDLVGAQVGGTDIVGFSISPFKEK